MSVARPRTAPAATHRAHAAAPSFDSRITAIGPGFDSRTAAAGPDSRATIHSRAAAGLDSRAAAGPDSRAAAGFDSRAATPAPAAIVRRPLPAHAAGSRPTVAFVRVIDPMAIAPDPTLVEAVDPAHTVELSAETVAALVAESTADVAGSPTPAAAEPPSLATRSRRAESDHRDLLAIAVLWGVLATCLLIVALCYVLSVIAQTSAHGS